MSKKLKVGTVMADGTVYAGISRGANKRLFVMPTDAPQLMTFDDSVHDVDMLNQAKSFGHDDWRLPTQAEMKVVFRNKQKGALSGTFNEASEKEGVPFTSPIGRECPGWYRTTDWGSATCTRGTFMKDGTTDRVLMMEATEVRYIREEDAPVLPPKPDMAVDKILAQQQRLKEISRQRKARMKNQLN